ncbi:MAG TPA: hypothetical protein DF712_17630 [Balneola sp.]|nr:hypothetical protein [Balneola sp.]
MNIDFNRICKLAGISQTGSSLNEASNRSYHDDPSLRKEKEIQHGNQLNEKKYEGHGSHDTDKEEGVRYENDEGYSARYEVEENEGHMGALEEEQNEAPHYSGYGSGSKDEADMPQGDEVVEVDINELMSEIRRAKRIMENKRRVAVQQNKAQQLQETHLKRIIKQEIDNILREMDDSAPDSSWVYGNKKPRRSKKGHTAQGSLLRGIGFLD